MKKEIVLRLKSGREFRFKCEEYSISTFKIDGTISIYFQTQDIECIAVICEEQNNEDD